jgi:tetratricopeptide (TPR) repeat protein
MVSLTAAGRVAACSLVLAFPVAGSVVSAQTKTASDKVPITTSSEEARQLYLKGRDFAEKLRAADARPLYQQAVAKDSSFALGYVGLANSSNTTKEFIEAVNQATALAGRVSDGERLLVLGLEAAMKGNPALVLTHYTELVRLYPSDERAHTLLGNTYFGRQDYDMAIKHFTKATTINPSFSQPYNQLGYAYRFLEKFSDAEVAFKKYVELIPGDPNPYDSYAELLLKMGRFDEAIKTYEKALAIDANFVASYIGIGSSHLSAGRTDQARTAFARIAAVARNTGERRLARFWAAASYVHDGATDKAIGELRAGYALSEAEGDLASMSGDLNQMGDVLREAGRLDEAAAKYAESIAAIDKAKVPAEVRQGTHRNQLFEDGRVAVARNDIATAKAKLAEYATQVAVKKAPFEIRQQHELAGLIALAEKRADAAIQDLSRANQQDPRVLYLMAVAWRDAGNTQKAAAFAGKAAKFNGIAFNYAYVRAKALRMTS